MTSAQVILKVKPQDPNIIVNLNHSLTLFERIAQLHQIKIQFEFFGDYALIFWHSCRDLKNTFKFLNQEPIGLSEHYIPSIETEAWIAECIRCPEGEKNTLLTFLTANIQEFLGEGRPVEMRDDKIIIALPTNFSFNKYLSAE